MFYTIPGDAWHYPLTVIEDIIMLEVILPKCI
jgi:hypothetical protein